MELKLDKPRIQRNPVSGRLLKGCTAHNKGKKISEWMAPEKIEKVMGNLNRSGNLKIPGANAKSVVAIKDGKLCGVFESSAAAFRKTKIVDENIRKCCNGKRKTAGGYRWFFENDNTWIDLINTEAIENTEL